MDVNKFSCSRCGNCCTNFSSQEEEKENTFISKFTFILNKQRLVINEWEKDEFAKELERIGSDRKLLPSLTYFDLKNNEQIILSYTLDDGACPFYKENRCIIYNKRPIVCRIFPFTTDISGAIFGTSNQIQLKKSMLCNSEKNDNSFDNIKEGNIMELFKNRYGDSFYSKIAVSLIDKAAADLTLNLHNKEIIKLATDSYPINFLLKRINNSKQIGISEFYKKHTGKELAKVGSTETAKRMVE